MSSIVIVGTGALACLFAARLTGIGIEVTMLGTWVEGLAALNEPAQAPGRLWCWLKHGKPVDPLASW
jgi:hypothetical protein